MNERTVPFDYLNLFKRFAEGICYYPSEIQIRPVYKPGRIVLLAMVRNSDTGLLIGRGGRVIQSIQRIFRAIGLVRDESIHITIEGQGSSEREQLFKTKKTWDKTPAAIELMADCLEGMDSAGKFTFEAEENHDTTLIVISGMIPGEIWTALEIAMEQWGKSQGRRIFLARPEEANR